MERITREIVKLSEEFTGIRHQLHRHPEVGFEEHLTSQWLADYLEKLGYDVTRGIGGTGLVATLRRGQGVKRLGLRADMDALPIQENSGKTWSSHQPGKFHGCGHDGHTTILLCAARYLAENPDFNGTLQLIFQPAEETLSGAKAMIDDGLFCRFPCDALFAMHNMPGLKSGEFYFADGAFMASSDNLQITVSGKGAHGAMPENGIDATLVACQIGCALQSIVSRNVAPADAAVITIGSIQSGDAPNVVNDTAIMKLSVRALKPEVRNKVLTRIRQLVTAQAESFGATASIQQLNGSPVLVNAQEETAFAAGVATRWFGADKVHLNTPPLMGSEDFTYMLEANPRGCYLLTGNGDEQGYSALHNPGYDFNDQLIVPCASFWVALVSEYLK